MGRNRLFIPQAQLDVWLSEDRIEVEGEEMVTRPEGQRFQLTTAVLFKSEVTGEPDAHDLVGRVKDLEQLAAMNAEHYADSVILEDNAYEVLEGFAGTPMEESNSVEVATGNSLSDAARALTGDGGRRSSGEIDLLARFLQAR